VSLVGATALAVELEDDGVMDEAVDGRGGGHGILEDAVPFTEDEVAGDEERAPLVALGHEGEEDLDFLSALLDVANVVEDEQVERVELGQSARESEVTFGSEELLDEAKGRGEEDGTTSLHERVTEGGCGVRLAATGQAEAEDVVGAVEKVAVSELVQSGDDGAWQARLVECVEGFSSRQVGRLEKSLAAPLAALVVLSLEDLEERRQSGLVPRTSETRNDLGRDGREFEASEQLAEAGGHVGREGSVGHEAPPTSSRS
jgi:hypothetical protein